jgi:hypothetical protein
MFIVNILGKLWFGPETWNRMQEMQNAPKVRLDRRYQSRYGEMNNGRSTNCSEESKEA